MITVTTSKESLIFGLARIRRLDLTNAAHLEQKVLKKNTKKFQTVLINLEGIQFIDTTGFSVLLRIQGVVETRGLRFCITNVSDEVSELIHLLKLDKVLNFAKDHSRIAVGS